MTFDRTDYTELAERRRQEAQQRRAGGDVVKLATMLSQAAVSAADLTADPKWNLFLQYVQAGIAQMEEMKAAYDAALHDSATLDHADLLAAKFGWAEADATIRAWRAVVSLPKDIEAAGDEARDLVLRMEQRA